MRLKKCGELAYVIEGLCADNPNGICEVEWTSPCGDEILLVNGVSFKMQNGKRGVTMTHFQGKENEIKVYSDGAWYPVYGIINENGRLVYSSRYMQENLTKLLLDSLALAQKYEACNKRLKELQQLYSGEEFL